MIINGKEMKFEKAITVSELLKNLDIPEDKVVVEVNFDILAKDQYAQRILKEEDKVEVVRFVGGG